MVAVKLGISRFEENKIRGCRLPRFSMVSAKTYRVVRSYLNLITILLANLIKAVKLSVVSQIANKLLIYLIARFTNFVA